MNENWEPVRWRRGILAIFAATALLGLFAMRAPLRAATMPQPAPTPAALVNQEQPGDIGDEETAGPSPQNIVQVYNTHDGDLRVKGRIQLAHVSGNDVVPVNEAQAISSCRNCSSFAVALQIVIAQLARPTLGG